MGQAYRPSAKASSRFRVLDAAFSRVWSRSKKPTPMRGPVESLQGVMVGESSLSMAGLRREPDAQHGEQACAGGRNRCGELHGADCEIGVVGIGLVRVIHPIQRQLRLT